MHPQMATDFTDSHMPMEMPGATDFDDIMHNIPVMATQGPTKPQTTEVVEVRLPNGDSRVMSRKDAAAHGAAPTGQLVAVSASQISFARVANPGIPMIPEGSEQILEVFQVPGHAMHHHQDPHMMHQMHQMHQDPRMMMHQEHPHPHPHPHMQPQPQPQPQQMMVQAMHAQPQMQQHHPQAQQVHMVRQVQQQVHAPGFPGQPMAFAPKEAAIPQGAQAFNPEYWQQAVDKQVDTALRREAGHAPQQQPMVNPQNVYDFADAQYYQRQMPGYQFTGEASL